ncbi:hypothetical protein ABT299_38710 [Spirillospora sp. NPDC000708]
MNGDDDRLERISSVSGQPFIAGVIAGAGTGVSPEFKERREEMPAAPMAV